MACVEFRIYPTACNRKSAVLGAEYRDLSASDSFALAVQIVYIVGHRGRNLAWDPANGYPVVSKDNTWHQLMLSDVTAANASYNVATTVTAAAANTAYAITLTQLFANGITLTGSPTTDITFTEGGLYQLAFSAQISSSNSSVVDIRFWPRINGTNATGSTIVANLNANGSTNVVSRTAMFRVSAGDVMKVMWATNATHGFLEAHAATAYAPASPSVTLNIVRVSL